ncbi:MAG: tRNA (adenosine(37)-N6)-dimethylallyltransferase MiaA [Lachnospira sp.]|nr:tRNA (adenosine(37)-N6)-dimethylallyltransferase MiaA [Lachnospira sp.]
MKKQPLIILTGPTAVGKTELSIKLAKAVGGEIISADSMQIYKYMDIGTAKIRTEEMQGIKHYLVDELEPDEEFNVTVFQKKAKEAMQEIYEKGKIPILVGGTGFYIQSVLYDITFTENEDDDTEYRKELYGIAQEHGADYLHDMLKKVDPAAAEAIHANNVKRVARALEYFHQTGECISKHNETESQKESPYNAVYFVLNNDRKILYERIDKRVDKMFDEGLVSEVEHLKEMGYNKELVSMQGIGYKEILAYLDGEYDEERAKYIIKRDTRHFAKRQLTWFKREKEVVWVNYQDYDCSADKMLSAMTDIIKERGIM